MLRALTLLAVLVFGFGIVSAQTNPTATPIGPVFVVTATPTVQPTEDPRLPVCSAPRQPGFVPHLVRPGERLADLMAGVQNMTLTQVAALNCLDDPNALPVGAVIWLPPSVSWASAPPLNTRQQARIDQFRASSNSVGNQEGVILSWQSVGVAAYVFICNGDLAAPCGRPGTAIPVPFSYTAPPINGFRYAGPVRYRLEVLNPDGTSIYRDVVINVTCSLKSLVPLRPGQPCPTQEPQPVYVAWQPFQAGVMMWFQDTRQIWVLTNVDSRIWVYPDTYVDGMPEPNDIPPNRNLWTPKRGFGLVWKRHKGPDVGWGVAPEVGVQSERQRAGRVSYTNYVRGPGNIVYALTVVPGQNTGYWARVVG
jgi:hypothetical protein